MTKLKFGVPCSQLKDYTKDCEIPCTSESEAMALAAGAWFAGKEPTVYIQNSGLGHIVDIVTSLYKPYNIPLPKLALSNRLKPEHHLFMHGITKDLLELIEYDNIIEIIEQDDQEICKCGSGIRLIPGFETIQYCIKCSKIYSIPTLMKIKTYRHLLYARKGSVEKQTFVECKDEVLEVTKNEKK